ncbi:MAG: cysteine--tRNA ligase [Xanthomonadales bacterium]|nr:cysteine--tRNA ligase [Xanthomonadales bacterium]
MSIVLYNTRSRNKEVFTPIDPQRVTMYVCGPTVYNYAHIGNARPAVIFDLLRQLLQLQHPQVVYARNITDVDDKINQAAADQGVAIAEISSQYADAYRKDMAALGVQAPNIEPHATDHIAEIINMIKQLISSGHAYAAEGHVLFSTESFSDYGKLSGRKIKDMIAGARVEVAPFKRHPADFVLWKPSVNPLPGWDSPWGWGRPGWHIECSAMAEKHLGNTIDIHGGGQDLVFPHHENEIAQSVCAHGGKAMANYWLHNGFITVEKRKMSKSLGNTLTVHELLKQWQGETLRYLLLSAHYRQPLDWSAGEVQRCQKTLERLYTILRSVKEQGLDLKIAAEIPADFLTALNDDINTPRALAELNALARRIGKLDTAIEKQAAAADLLAAGALLGLLQADPSEWLNAGSAKTSNVDANAIQTMVEARDAARASRDFAEADRLRDVLLEMGISLEDSPDGTRWRI